MPLPPFVKFDNLTRNFQITPSKSTKQGKYQVVVQASDVFGGITLQSFYLTIVPVEDAKKVQAKPNIILPNA